jgi:hypothetical protein
VSARGVTDRAAHARQVDVPARDEEYATTGHVPDGLTPPRAVAVTQATGAGAASCAASMAERISATDSASGVTEVSTTRSGRAGSS